MDHHALDYYCRYSEDCSQGHFHEVVLLHDAPFIEWPQALEMAPTLPKGWYELAQLSCYERIEFVADFWLTTLPYQPHLDQNLKKFFESLDDIGVFLTQQKYGDNFEPHLIYSFKNHEGFFHGSPPIKEADLLNLKRQFLEYILPTDYLEFLRIHDGFAKWPDTGLILSSSMKETYEDFQKTLENDLPLKTHKGRTINPKTLIPFYKSFGMPFFQCFWAEWYPKQEMGNIYYSGNSHTIEKTTDARDPIETMSFETFLDWLLFYLEKID